MHLGWTGLVHTFQDVRAQFGHDDDGAGNADDLVHHALLAGRGAFEHCVKRRDQRHAEAAYQGQDVRAIIAAENTELMLEERNFNAGAVQFVGETFIGRRIIVADDVSDFLGVIVGLGGVLHNREPPFGAREFLAQACERVPGERCNPAASWREIADHRRAVDVLTDTGFGLDRPERVDNRRRGIKSHVRCSCDSGGPKASNARMCSRFPLRFRAVNPS